MNHPPNTRRALLPNSLGNWTWHRYTESRPTQVRVPITDDTGAAVDWTQEDAVLHYFQCEDTGQERSWGCEEAGS